MTQRNGDRNVRRCVAMLLLGGCQHSLYVKATQTFAESTSAGIGSFRSAAPTAHALCIARAESQFLNQKFGARTGSSSDRIPSVCSCRRPRSG